MLFRYNPLVAQTYDAAGNQESMGTDTLTYDAENRQTKVSDSSSQETYTYSYDGLGARVSKTAQSVTTMYVHDVFGNLSAEYTSQAPVDQPCTTCYLSWDHLGSTRLVTDAGGAVVARHDFLPFGQELSGGVGGRNDFWGQTDQVTAKFTSQERDTETGMDFFQARYHANQQGRFLSVDPGQAAADPGNPQSWNGYGYVLGNPVVYVDPSGMDPGDCDDDPSCGWPFPPIWPPPIFDNPASQPPPPPPPAVSTGGLNVPNSGVYDNGWPNGETNGLPPGVSVPGPLSPQVLLGLWGWDCSSGVCIPGLEFDADQSDGLNPDAVQVFSRVGATARTLTNPCSMIGFYVASATGVAWALDTTEVVAAVDTVRIPIVLKRGAAATTALITLYRMNPAQLASTIAKRAKQVESLAQGFCEWVGNVNW